MSPARARSLASASSESAAARPRGSPPRWACAAAGARAAAATSAVTVVRAAVARRSERFSLVPSWREGSGRASEPAGHRVTRGRPPGSSRVRRHSARALHGDTRAGGAPEGGGDRRRPGAPVPVAGGYLRSGAGGTQLGALRRNRYTGSHGKFRPGAEGLTSHIRTFGPAAARAPPGKIGQSFAAARTVRRRSLPQVAARGWQLLFAAVRSYLPVFAASP